jgi:iron complex outermembrane receptor protein
MGTLQLNAPTAWTGNGVLDKAMIYFTYAKGFKSGGYNGNGDTASGSLSSFNPERVNNYEAGLKFSMFGHRLTGSVAHFNMNYESIQLTVAGLNPDTLAIVTSIFNAGAAKIYGFEVESQLLLFGSLRLGFNGDFTNARYTKFDDSSVAGGSRTNEPLPFIPNYRVSGSIENRFALGGDMAVTPRLQITRTGERFLITDKSPAVREIGRQPAFTLVDASLRFEINRMITIDIYGKNLFNQRYKDDVLSLGFAVETFYAPPVTYGVNARFKF